jgi:pimeloyl-ACP methyl ester carboxylesterase
MHAETTTATPTSTSTTTVDHRRRRGRLYVEEWGEGDRVVLVHGSLATGAEEWDAQRPLAEEGFRLVVIDRRGYGTSSSCWATARTWSVTPTAASVRCWPPPAGPRRPAR